MQLSLRIGPDTSLQPVQAAPPAVLAQSFLFH